VGDKDKMSEQDIDWAGALRGALEEFGCQTGTVHLLDPEDGMLKLVASEGIPESLMGVVSVIPVGKGIAGAAAERREAVQICNLQEDDGGGVARPGAKRTGVGGSLAIPLLDGERLVGTFGIGKHEPYEFGKEEEERLMRLCHELGYSR